MNRSLWLLALCQGLFLTHNVCLIAINGLVGLALAPVGWMATLPVTAYVVGGALSAPLVARAQARWGRRRSFQLGLWVAMATAALCAWAAWQRQFGLLTLATLLAGFYNANAQLYRFAGPELVPAPQKESAISLVLAGGALSFIEFPPHTAPSPGADPGRPLRELAREPAFVVAIAAGALGYGVMNLLMAATPIAMAQCGHPFSAAALVLEWHVLGMFVPGFFTGRLIRRFGALPVMGAGVVLNLACVALALSGVAVMDFLLARSEEHT